MFVYQIQAEGTLDQVVQARVEGKADVQDLLMEYCKMKALHWCFPFVRLLLFGTCKRNHPKRVLQCLRHITVPTSRLFHEATPRRPARKVTVVPDSGSFIVYYSQCGRLPLVVQYLVDTLRKRMAP